MRPLPRIRKEGVASIDAFVLSGGLHIFPPRWEMSSSCGIRRGVQHSFDRVNIEDFLGVPWAVSPPILLEIRLSIPDSHPRTNRPRVPDLRRIPTEMIQLSGPIKPKLRVSRMSGVAPPTTITGAIWGETYDSQGALRGHYRFGDRYFDRNGIPSTAADGGPTSLRAKLGRSR